MAEGGTRPDGSHGDTADDPGELWMQAMRDERFDDAWTISDAALAARDRSRRDDPAAPYHRRWVWDGRDLAGRHVLVRCYHGLGDTIQFARFLPRLAARAAGVTLEVQPSLAGLLATLPGVDRIIAFDPARPTPAGDCDIEVGELPHALRCAPNAVAMPYLSAAPAPLSAGTIAICYGAGDWDPARSVPPALFTSICHAHAAVTMMPEPTALAVRNPAGCPLDMAETAALVAGAGLVVTVDTMVAHLAGAMGRPTWLLLKTDPDWRWPRDGRTTPWYPGMRIYRQARPGDWTGVLAEVERDLATGLEHDEATSDDLQPGHAQRSGLLG